MTRVPTKTATFFVCPCGDGARRHYVDHLVDGHRAGPWHCDACGVGWFVTKHADGVDLEDSGRRAKKTRVTLRLPPQDKDVLFVLDAKHYGGECGCEYFYNEYTCPANWMRDVEKISVGDDEDPHGLFEFVSCEVEP